MADVDVSKDLLEKLEKEFKSRLSSSNVNYWRNRVEDYGRQEDLQNYAQVLGHVFAESVKSTVSSEVLPNGQMYYNIAEKLFGPLLKQNDDLVKRAAGVVANRMNIAVKATVKPQIPPMDEERARGIYNLASSRARYDDIADEVAETLENYIQNSADSTIKRHAEFLRDSGFSLVVIRECESDACDYCQDLAGEYEGDIPKEAFSRHLGCRCQIIYKNKRGIITRQGYDGVFDDVETLQKRRRIGL